jgi:hypothetical protein
VPAYDTRPIELRQVPNDCHIAYRAVRYSVDPGAVGRTVTVRAEGERIGDAFSVYLGDAVVARHRIHPKGTERVTLPEHRERIRALTRGPELNRHPRRGTQPNFRQAPRPLDRLVTPAAAWPIVQVRSLALYEAVSGGVQ